MNAKEGLHPNQVLELMKQLSELDSVIFLEYGVPEEAVGYKHDLRLEVDSSDFEGEEAILTQAMDRVEELTREGREGAFVIAQEGGKVIYDVFAPAI